VSDGEALSNWDRIMRHQAEAEGASTIVALRLLDRIPAAGTLIGPAGPAVAAPAE
jgi:hypothetical protein